jgi:hypothetical protein
VIRAMRDWGRRHLSQLSDGRLPDAMMLEALAQPYHGISFRFDKDRTGTGPTKASPPIPSVFTTRTRGA